MFQKTSAIEKKLWIRGREGGKEGGREGLLRFSVRTYCLTVPNNFVEDPFYVRQKIWYRNKLAIREGASITIFPQTVLSHSFLSSRRGIFLCFRKFRVSKKNYAYEGNITIFYRKFVVSLYRKTS